MLRTFKVVSRKMGIDDTTAPAPPPVGPPRSSSTYTLGRLTGSGGIPSA